MTLATQDKEVDLYRVGQRIRALRLNQKYTQAALAEAADLSVPYLSHVERGTKKISLQALLRIAAALHVTADQLLLGVQANDKSVYIPQVCELLDDCSPSEFYVILETSKAVKHALRHHVLK